MLYTHLDLIMARRNHYERRTRELFDDLGLDAKEYLKTSSRVRKLTKALQELKGVRLTTGVITTATLEKTKDGKDYKLIVRKSVHTSLSLAEPVHPLSESGGGVVSETQSAATNSELTAQAKELVTHFHKRFHNTEISSPNSKELGQAISLIARHGIDLARHIVEFSYHAAQETNYKPQTFGGILQYAPRALAAFEETKRKQMEQTIVKDCPLCDRSGFIYFDTADPRYPSTIMRCPHKLEIIQAVEQKKGWRFVPNSH